MKKFYDYEVDSNGNVYSNKSNQPKQLKPYLNKSNGYMYVKLYFKNKLMNISLHRLVAMLYLDDYTEDKQVNHIDSNKQNNHINNLEMVTCKENISHFLKNNTNFKPYNIKITNIYSDIDIVVETHQEAANLIGYKKRSCISKLLEGTFQNKNGYKVEKIYLN